MGSLSNLYVSQSYQSLLHLGTDTSFFPVGANAPQGYIGVQDGLGYNAGFAISSSGEMYFSKSVIINEDLSINGDLDVDGNFIVSGTFDIEGKVTVNDSVRVNGNLEVSGATTLTGSLVVTNAMTASNMFITNDLIVSGTLNAFKIVTTIESSSVIFSSGSNILGDSILDTQTLNGTIIMSGSSQLTGSMGITGNFTADGSGTFGGSGSFIGDLTATGNISSSTLSGVGNVTLYSASVNSRLAFLEGPFSTSVDLRLDNLEAWSSSLQTTFVTETQLTQTASFLQNQINQKLNTSSFDAYSSSIYNGLQVDGSLTRVKAGLQITGSMNITGSMIYSGSVRGVVIPLSITSQTASMDCSLGNFFTLTLVSGSNTMLTATNIQPGETIGLRVIQPATNGTLTYTSVLKFPQAFPYIATPISGAVDILSFQSYDTTALYGVAVNTMI
jgi:cytoskeletal protein CcmA (bactofilin family)